MRGASSSNTPTFSGTTTAPTAACWTGAQGDGKDLVLDIDVQGARQLKSKIPDAVTYLHPGASREILEQRLRARGEDSDDSHRAAAAQGGRGDPELQPVRLRAGE